MGLPCQTSSMVLPPRPRTALPTGMSVTWKPVPKMITSASRSTPAASTTPVAVALTTPSVISSTLSLASAGYHRFEGRIRLQPMV